MKEDAIRSGFLTSFSLIKVFLHSCAKDRDCSFSLSPSLSLSVSLWDLVVHHLWSLTHPEIFLSFDYFAPPSSLSPSPPPDAPCQESLCGDKASDPLPRRMTLYGMQSLSRHLWLKTVKWNRPIVFVSESWPVTDADWVSANTKSQMLISCRRRLAEPVTHPPWISQWTRRNR